MAGLGRAGAVPAATSGIEMWLQWVQGKLCSQQGMWEAGKEARTSPHCQDLEACLVWVALG